MERKRDTELERKRGGKEAALGFASGRAHSSNIDSVLLFCFFSLLLLLRPHPQLSLSLSLSLRVLCRPHRIEPIARVALPSNCCCFVCQNKLGGLLKFLIILYIFAAISVLCVRVQLFFKGPLDREIAELLHVLLLLCS